MVRKVNYGTLRSAWSRDNGRTSSGVIRLPVAIGSPPDEDMFWAMRSATRFTWS